MDMIKKLVLFFSLYLFCACADNVTHVHNYCTTEEIEILVEDIFNKELLIEEIKKYNFKFEDIILAQAILESGLKLREHNNLFGMKVAKKRPTIAKRTDKSMHAKYDHWQESVMDRALFEAAYMRGKTRKEYLEYLGNNYAEDKNYVNKLNKIIDGL